MFDEAHNVEAISRKMASLQGQLYRRNLEQSMADLNSLIELNPTHDLKQTIGQWKLFIESIVNYLCNDSLPVNNETKYSLVELEQLSDTNKRDLWLDVIGYQRLKTSQKELLKTEITNRVRSLMDAVVRSYDYMMNKKNTAAYRVLVKKEPYNAQNHQHLARLNKKNDSLKDIVPDFYHELQVRDRAF